MAGPAPTEQEISTGRTDKIVDLPSEEKKWTSSVAKDAEKAARHPFTPDQATPPAAQRVPTTKTGIQIQPGINAEPWIDTADMADIAGNTVDYVINLPTGDKGLSAPDETAPGHRGISKLKERLRKLFRSK